VLSYAIKCLEHQKQLFLRRACCTSGQANLQRFQWLSEWGFWARRFLGTSPVTRAGSDVKTRASQKRMPLDRSLAETLSQYQLRFASRRNNENWIFVNPATGKPYWPRRVQENWLVPAAKKLGIGRIGWHTFRHSHSTLLHALGVDLKMQQELLRRADVRTTLNIYTQAVPSALREANCRVVRLVIPAQVA
jgi:integrase